LRDRWRSQIERHRLRRELVTTFIANIIVDRAGIGFVEGLQERSGRSAADVARALAIVVSAFGLREKWQHIEALDNKVPAGVQIDMLFQTQRLVEHATLWFLRYGSTPLDMAAHLDAYRPGIEAFQEVLPQHLFHGGEEPISQQA